MKEQGPELKPSGTPLPLMQRILLRTFVGPFVTKKESRESIRQRYEKATSDILSIYDSASSEKRNTKILVQPIRGLEDSSRYWSLEGVLEHLLIVSKGVEQVILQLSEGRVPAGQANLADMKPQFQKPSFRDEFQSYAPGLIERLDRELAKPGRDFYSKAKFFHPWFGPIEARQWYWLLATHQQIHRKQAREIARKIL